MFMFARQYLLGWLPLNYAAIPVLCNQTILFNIVTISIIMNNNLGR